MKMNGKMNGKKAFEMAVLSQDAYLPPAEFAAKYRDFEFISEESTQVYIVQLCGSICVAFRGTEIESFQDIKLDLEFLKSPEPGGWSYCHTGFQEGIDLVWEELEAKVRALQQETNLPLVSTGHSLGAALATICHARLGDMATSELYTFGSPRVFDKAGARGFRYQRPLVYRFVNHTDLVTRIPKIGYHHVGIPYYLNEAGALKIDPPWWYRSWEYAKGMLGGFVRFEVDSLEDHPVDNYVNKLARYAK